jgi:uncharacterized protein YndB with AHSA1/START domain
MIMAGKFERTYDVNAPVERLWRVFKDDKLYGRIFAWPNATPEQEADTSRNVVIESEPMKRLKWGPGSDSHLPDPAEFTIDFESTAARCRFTVTRESFGEGELADAFAESHWLGWSHGFCNIIFYLETGQFPLKRASGGDDAQSSTGMIYKERDWGIEELEVTPGTFAEAAGLARGDRIVRIGGLPIFTRNDIWGFLTEHSAGTEVVVDYVRGGERREGQGRLSDKAHGAWGE